MNLNPTHYFLKRYHSPDLKADELRRMLNFWFPFLVNRIRIISITDDFHKIINRQSFTSIGLEFSGYKDDFISGLLLGFGLTGLGFGILYTFNFLSVESIQFSLKTQLFYVFVYTLISLSEEIAVRGYILQNLSKSFNKYIALVLSSLAFVYIRGTYSDWNNIDLAMVAGTPSPWVIVPILNLFPILISYFRLHFYVLY